MRRHEDWIRQSRKDYQHALHSLDAGDYEWSCFAAHQAAEKAVKAVCEANGLEAWEHSVTFLLASLPTELKPAASLQDTARQLDRHYIPSRYPDSHPGGAPLDYYTATEAKTACSHAEEVLRFAETILAGLGSTQGS